MSYARGYKLGAIGVVNFIRDSLKSSPKFIAENALYYLTQNIGALSSRSDYQITLQFFAQLQEECVRLGVSSPLFKSSNVILFNANLRESNANGREFAIIRVSRLWRDPAKV